MENSNQNPIPPKDRISPSSVYFCPMECEGEKVYFTQGKRCPVCNMYLVPIEEKEGFKKSEKTLESQISNLESRIGDFFCPMFCEGDKTYDSDIGCPICHMHLQEITPELVQSSKVPIHSSSSKQNLESSKGRYYCPMFCEGDKTYPENVGCPICGMDLVKITRNNDESEDDTYKILQRKFWISAIFTVPIFVLSMGGMFFDLPISAKMSGILQLIFTIPIVFYTGWFLFKRAFVSFKTWNLNMFSLIGLGAGTAFIYSVFALIFPNLVPAEFIQNHHETPLYFEAVAVILTLVIFGQMLEAKAHKKTGNAIKDLMNLAPKEAHLIVENSEKNILVSKIKVGDILRVKPGEKIPVDGEITDGNTTIDESMITGEPISLEKKLGDKVTSGTINGNQVFLMKTEKIGKDTLLSQIIEMVNTASRSRAPIQKLTDQVSKVFVPVVVVISLLTFVFWYFFGGDGKTIFALVNALAVLIVACPCALGLATPMSVMVGIGKGAKNGILIKNAEALEEMSKINVLITDKTGTLTEGKASLMHLFFEKYTKNEVLQLAASLNQNSEHPLSNAVLKAFREHNEVEKLPSTFKEVKNFENISGRGIYGEIDGKKVFLVNRNYVKDSIEISANLLQQAENLENNANTVSILIIDKKAVAVFGFKDKLKDNAKKSIEFFQKKGIEIVMMTGDNEQTAKLVAETLGIKKYVANCLPQDKINEVEKLQKLGNKVAMCGDGINDAPALAKADVGIAMSTGTDISMNSAEITLLKGDILSAAKAKILSDQMMKNVKENLFFAFAYNTLGIPIAAGLLYPFFGILLSPMIAAAAMSFSSVSVIANSLRLNRVRLDIS